MTATVCLAPTNTLPYPEGGGHLWEYLPWALALQEVGCRVLWMEEVFFRHDEDHMVRTLEERLHTYGLDDALVLYTSSERPLPATLKDRPGLEAATETDLLLNLRYDTAPEVVRRFRRSALVDLDPGLLQIWMAAGKIAVAPHDAYVTISEVVGTPEALFPDCGLRWHPVPRPVFLPAWPPAGIPPADAPYTTLSHWWGEWIELGGDMWSNSKRDSFLQFLAIPPRSPAPLELALTLGPGGEADRLLLDRNGWRVRNGWEVAGSPEAFAEYVRTSRGEFSCAKPSCMRLQNAWISGRTLAYLASGRPAVVQHTGPSSLLPEDEGVIRFRTPEEAVRGLEEVESDYDRHAYAARKVAEESFDAVRTATRVLEVALA